MARRGHSEGSVYKRKDGRWVASITLEQRKRKYFYGDTRREVLEKLKIALHEQQQGTLATGPQQLFRTYIEHWLEEAYKPSVKLLSYQQYRSAVKNHLIPGLGHLPLQKITAAKIQALYAEKRNDGLAPRTITFIHAVLHSALENAVKWGLVSRNVAKLVSLPRAQRYEAKTLTSEQAKKLLETARESHIEALLVMAVTTGMRRGELLALHWGDIDFKKGVIFVQRTVNRITGHGFQETEPKTKSSRRRIVIPEMAVEVLKVHCMHQDEVRIKAGERWWDQGIVFCNRFGGHMNPERMVSMFHKVLEDAGLPNMRFHDLWHSAATILLVAGVHPKLVQERMGHSTIAMTIDIYSHVIPSMQQEVVDKIDNIFERF